MSIKFHTLIPSASLDVPEACVLYGAEAAFSSPLVLTAKKNDTAAYLLFHRSSNKNSRLHISGGRRRFKKPAGMQKTAFAST
jgi:hypothetical protein